MRVAIHETVDKADGVVFRCTLSGSAADRWLEVPAWMFDRARCLDPSRLTASPFVSMDALSVLSDLLRQALKPPLSSSNAPHSGASRSSHDQNRGEAHDHAKPGTTASDAGRTAKASAKRAFPADRPVRRRNAHADAGMAGPAGGDAGYADRPDGAPDPGARSDQQPGLTATSTNTSSTFYASAQLSARYEKARRGELVRGPASRSARRVSPTKRQLRSAKAR
jgi:hypothetical protein